MVKTFNTTLAQTLSGISYIIYTTEGEFPRQNQPCYGELRKYEKTHKGECTQPGNHKPGDLHSPFPDGTPIGLVVPFPRITKTVKTDRVFRAMFSKDSPWYIGFKDVSFFNITDSDRIGGVIIDNMEIDPTVLVNALKTLQSFQSPQVVDDFCDLVDNGLTENEALAVIMLNGSGSILNGVQPTGGYKAPTQFSAKRFFNKTPNDLTGGVLRDRIDYNRTDMHKPFWGESTEGAINWQVEASKAGAPKFTGYAAIKPEEKEARRAEFVKSFVSAAKVVFETAIKNEKDPEIKPFNWTTTSGKSKEKGDVISLKAPAKG